MGTGSQLDVTSLWVMVTELRRATDASEDSESQDIFLSRDPEFQLLWNLEIGGGSQPGL